MHMLLSSYFIPSLYATKLLDHVDEEEFDQISRVASLQKADDGDQVDRSMHGHRNTLPARISRSSLKRPKRTFVELQSCDDGADAEADLMADEQLRVMLPEECLQCGQCVLQTRRRVVSSSTAKACIACTIALLVFALVALVFAEDSLWTSR